MNFLTMKKVLQENITSSLIRELEKSHSKVRIYSKAIFRGWEKEYSEKRMDSLIRIVDQWIDDFEKRSFFSSLSEIEKFHSESVIEHFFRFLYSYFTLTPNLLSEYELEEICLGIMPAKISENEDYFCSIVPVLSRFFQFIEQKGIINNSEKLIRNLQEIQYDIVLAASTPENWGMAKTLVMGAIDAGVDLDDEDELQNYVYQLNNGITSEEFCQEGNFWSVGKIQAMTTEEIIDQLREFGVPFEKDEFLEDIKHVNAAMDIGQKWEDNYTITAAGLDEDFIWIAPIVLWKRLAPDIINTERIEELIDEGYDFAGRGNHEAACNIWLRAWEHLKEKCDPGMITLRDIEEIFNGGLSLFNYIAELSMELLNAGLHNNGYIKKRIAFCTELLERFPKMNDIYVQKLLSDLGESYLEYNEVKKGIIKLNELIEKYPNYFGGYLVLGDFFGDVRHVDYFDDEKALHYYKLGLNHTKYDNELFESRIKELEADKLSFELNIALLEEYQTFLAEKDYSQNTYDQKKESANSFLHYLIFHEQLIHLEMLVESLNYEYILNYIGVYKLLNRKISSKSALIRELRHLKTYLQYFGEQFVLPKHVIKDIEKVLGAKDFFIERLKTFKDLGINNKNGPEKWKILKRWRKIMPKYHQWIEPKSEEDGKKA